MDFPNLLPSDYFKELTNSLTFRTLRTVLVLTCKPFVSALWLWS